MAGTHSNIADAKFQIFVPFNFLDRNVADLLVHIKVGILRHLDFHLELSVAARGSLEFDSRIAALDLVVYLRILHVILPSRFNGVMKGDLIGVAPHDSDIPHAQMYVQHPSGKKLTSLIVGFFLIQSGTKRNQQHAEYDRPKDGWPPEHRQTDGRSSEHRAPPERAC